MLDKGKDKEEKSDGIYWDQTKDSTYILTSMFASDLYPLLSDYTMT